MSTEHAAVARTHIRGRSTSPLRERPLRKVPSPLRHAEFRPLAMEYAMSPEPKSSCKFYNAHEEDEEEVSTPGGTPGGYCSTFRTVGYNTVGGKTFMSGKCPHCKRLVKSDKQICTPNATPPQSPWRMANLQSPLRSPIRSRTVVGGQTSFRSPLRSPLRSPVKESFFGAPDSKAPSPRPAAEASESTKPRSPVRAPLRSPFRGSFFGGPTDDNKAPSTKPAVDTTESTRIPRGRSRSPGPSYPETRMPAPDASARGPRGRSRSPGPSFPETRMPAPDASARGPRGRSRSPGPCPEARSMPAPDAATRGPRSPGPRSPPRSPWRGSFFGGAADDEGPKHIGKTRGAHSPGPRSPLRVKVDYVTEFERAEQEERESAAASAAERKQQRGWRSPLRSPLKSPLRSPMKGGFFGRGNKGGGVPPVVGTE